MFRLPSVQVWNNAKKCGNIAGANGAIHPHTFRHLFAIHLVRYGMNIRKVQLLFGYADLNTTQVYLQFKDEDLRDVYNKVQVLKYNSSNGEHHSTRSTLRCLMLNPSKSLTSLRWKEKEKKNEKVKLWLQWLITIQVTYLIGRTTPICLP